MFGDTRFRNKFLKKTQVTNQLSHYPGTAEDMKHIMKVQSSHQTLLCGQKHVSSYSTVVVNWEENGKKVSFERDPDGTEKIKKKKSSMVIRLPMKSEKLITKGTQTDYRESEAQTLPWKHEIKAERKILAELLLLDWFNQGEACAQSEKKNIPPGVEEVSLTEKARQKLAWENIIERLRGKENETLRTSLVRGLAFSETAFKKAKRAEEEQERLAMSRQQMKEALVTFEKKLHLRLQRSYDGFKREKESNILSWNHQFRRNIRKMKSARMQHKMRSDIVTMHEDKTSQLYAPKCRDGENPCFGHEVIDIQCRYLKRYHGLEFLETRIANILQPQFLKSSFETRSSRPEKIRLCLKEFRVKEPKEKLKSPSLKVSTPAATPELLIPKIRKMCSE